MKEYNVQKAQLNSENGTVMGWLSSHTNQRGGAVGTRDWKPGGEGGKSLFNGVR